MNIKRKIRELDILLVLKASFGSAIAVFLANRLNLMYSFSAGIITLLTLQNTKIETLRITSKRVLAFIAAIILAYPIFTNFGYTTVAFGGFIFLFVGICSILGLKDGIVMNAVIVTHFLIEKRMDISMLVNEIGILSIGMSIGIVLNLIMVKHTKQIRRDQAIVENKITDILACIANYLVEDPACSEGNLSRRIDFNGVDRTLENLLSKAYRDSGNTLLSETKYQISFFEMRKLQIIVLKSITESVQKIDGVFPQSIELSNFIKKISKEFHELNNVEGLIYKVKKLNRYYKRDELPKNRHEFENRAILFSVLKDLERFLEIKRTFVKEEFEID